VDVVAGVDVAEHIPAGMIGIIVDGEVDPAIPAPVGAKPPI